MVEYTQTIHVVYIGCVNITYCMTTITVSPSTHARLVNDKTLELRSIEKVILNLYDRADGIKPPSVVASSKHQEVRWEDLSEDEKRNVPVECRPDKEA